MKERKHSDVTVSRAYSVFYWLMALALTVATYGLILPFAIWYKLAVINRTKIIFNEGTKAMTFQRGRWFVKDDDRVPVRAIDNVKLDRSILGKLFGWANITVETRSERYRIKHIGTAQAEQFRERFLDAT